MTVASSYRKLRRSVVIKPPIAFSQPNTLIYRRLDRPPPPALAVLALQHAALISVFLVVAVTVARLAGLSADDGRNFLALTMIAGGAGAILQSRGRCGIGSGYLVPPTTTTILLPAAGAAIAAGGLPLMLGMTMYAGAAAALIARSVRRLRPVFTPEITGFVVLMVGLSVMVLAMRNFLGIGLPAAELRPTLTVATLSLATMVALNVWGGGRLRLYSTLVGIAIGYAAAATLGLLGHGELEGFRAAPMLSLPVPLTFGLAFDPGLLVPFTIAAVAIALNAIGAITAAQRVEDPDWKRPEMESLTRGITADGLTTLLAGLLGGFGQASTSGAVGLSQATAANSRVIGFAVGGLLIALAFVPKLAALLLAMPAGVVGAALTFSGSFLVTSAIQMIASRMLDSRKVFVLGISFALGIAALMYPDHFRAAPPWLVPFVGSPLSISVMTAVLLSLLFRIGIHSRSAMTFDSQAFDPRALADFMAQQGALWGAPQDVAHRAEFMTVEAVETLVGSGLVRDAVEVGRQTGPVPVPGGLITVSTRFDEFAFEVTIRYRGELLEPVAERPSAEAVLENDGHLLLARYLVGRTADRMRSERQGDQSALILTLGN
ncbi:MAG TPA: solute carrier family 23 protein [Thalassobaculum sp.]